MYAKIPRYLGKTEKGQLDGFAEHIRLVDTSYEIITMSETIPNIILHFKYLKILHCFSYYEYNIRIQPPRKTNIMYRVAMSMHMRPSSVTLVLASPRGLM